MDLLVVVLRSGPRGAVGKLLDLDSPILGQIRLDRDNECL